MNKKKKHLINFVCLVLILGFVKLVLAQEPLPNPFETLQVKSLQGEIQTSPTEEDIIEKETIKVSLSLSSSSNGISPINEYVEIVCVDGKQEIHISLPAGVFEETQEGSFNIIDPNDPQAIGIKIFLLDEFGTKIESYEKFLTFLDSSITVEAINNFKMELEMESLYNRQSNGFAGPRCSRDTRSPDRTWVLYIGDDLGTIGDVNDDFTKTEFYIVAGEN